MNHMRILNSLQNHGPSFECLQKCLDWSDAKALRATSRWTKKHLIGGWQIRYTLEMRCKHNERWIITLISDDSEDMFLLKPINLPIKEARELQFQRKRKFDWSELTDYPCFKRYVWVRDEPIPDSRPGSRYDGPGVGVEEFFDSIGSNREGILITDHFVIDTDL